MSSIGSISSLPLQGSHYFTAKDEYGNNRTLHRDQLPEDAEVGDDFAYRVDFFKNSAVTLHHEDGGS